MKLKTRGFALEVKAEDMNADGTFSGYASVFGELDSYNEIVMPGAFKKTLATWGKKGSLPPVLWQHESKQPIGIHTAMSTDSKGLLVEGKLATGMGVPTADMAYALTKLKAVNGMSIGYQCDNWTEDTKAKTVELNEINLWENSIVTFPACAGATIDNVKEIEVFTDLPSMEQLEDLLREAGLSRSQAKAVAGKGLSHLLRQREAGSTLGEKSMADLAALFDNRYGATT